MTSHFSSSIEDAASTNYDTGYFYATVSSNNQIMNPENFTPGLKQSNPIVPPSNPFENDVFVPNNNYLFTYYYHLIDNMPRNTMGICGYTGISMLLSFYDSYWYDYFVTEQYDSEKSFLDSSLLNSSVADSYNSPGVKNNITSSGPSIETFKKEIKNMGITDEQSATFKDELDKRISGFVLEQINSNTFLGKLFQVAIDNQIIKSRYIPGCSVNNDYYLNGIGVNYDIMSTVLGGYISSNNSIKNRVSIVTSKLQNDSQIEKTRIRSEIINIVKSGRPVLMGGNGYEDNNHNGVQDFTNDPNTNEGTFGHVVVAYDYDEVNDILYGNMGWSHEAQVHRNLDEFFNIQISDYWSIKILDIPVDRPNNYIFTDKNAYYSPYYDSIYSVMTAIHHGFAPSYGPADSSISQTIVLPYSNDTIYSSRQRCGLIEGKCVNLSPKRYAPGISFLEYTFDKDVRRFEVGLSWWSKNEMVGIGNSTYCIEYSLNGIDYITAIDLWRDVTLSKDKDSPTAVIIYLPVGVRKIRYFAQCLNPVNDRNKGRLSIHKTLIEYYG